MCRNIARQEEKRKKSLMRQREESWGRTKWVKEMNVEVKRGRSHTFHRSEEQQDCDDAAGLDANADEDQTSR